MPEVHASRGAPAAVAAERRLDPEPREGRGAALGLQQGAGASGRILGPLLAGLLFDRVGVEAPYLVAAALAVAAIALVRDSDA